MQELTEAKDIAKYCTESLLSVVEGLAKFAKKLEEFRNLDLNDQVKYFQWMWLVVSKVCI